MTMPGVNLPKSVMDRLRKWRRYGTAWQDPWVTGAGKMLIGPSGRLRSTWLLSDWMKSRLASRYHYEARSQVALDVASHYPGGDYFEFGSDSLLTFRSFLSAFDLHGLGKVHPDTRFYAFDIFGKASPSDKVSSEDRWFFEHYAGSDKLELAKAALARHRVLVDRCVIRQGYFQETLNDAFKEELRREDRKIGFAFLDCNLSSSYKVCFQFLEEFMHPGRCFIYMDEYYGAFDVPLMYEDFCANLKRRHGLASYFVRNAGGLAHCSFSCIRARSDS
jgi:hypothetical protein